MNTDIKILHRELYSPPKGAFVDVEVPPLHYLAIDGSGDPNTAPRYAAAVAALYTTGYSIRAALKTRTGDTFTVGPLEGLWDSDDPSDFTTRRKGLWRWTMMIALPEVATPDDADAGIRVAAVKKPELPIADVRVQTLTEGHCLQILHIGSYDDEGPTLHRLHEQVMPERGLTFNGLHHEIYLGDPRRTAPERLRTILRQPVRSA